jgi:hypothetical protein
MLEILTAGARILVDHRDPGAGIGGSARRR